MNLSNLKKDNTGFTLIEVIVCLMLLGIVGSFATFFIVSGLKGYMLSTQNAALTRKASLAMARIAKEFNSEMKEVDVITGSSVRYVYQYNPRFYRYVALVGTGERKEVKIVVGDETMPVPEGSDPEVLIDQVKNFELAFKKCDGSDWIVGNDMDDLCKIGVKLTLFINPIGIEEIPFETTVNPPNPHYIIGSADSVFRRFTGKIYVANS